MLFRYRLKPRNHIDIAGENLKTMVLYFLYEVELKRKNIPLAFASYKNFFDRISATLAFKTGYDLSERNSNYKLFYKEKELRKLYAGVPDIGSLIGKAHDLRNANPISYDSAELFENDKTIKYLESCISGLNKLVNDYRSMHNHRLKNSTPLHASVRRRDL